MAFDPPLPIDSVLSELTAALRARNAAVLVAPPGAGKTTRVPLVLADEPWAQGKKIIVLEPRRRARPLRAWPRRLGRKPAARSAIGCASAPRCRAQPASKS
jgi:hypothetical protein